MPSSTASSTTTAEPSRSVGRLLLTGLALVVLIGLAAPLEAQQPMPVWLAGCWRMAEAGQVTDEVWLGPSGGAMVGMSRTVENDTLRSWELMVIRLGGNGVTFEATPSGQPTAVFLAITAPDSSIAFENLTHDYPQVIRYVRRGADSLLAVVSGTIHERQRSIEFHYARASCPAS